MDDRFSYEDFDLLIEPGEREHYRARVLRSPVGESSPRAIQGAVLARGVGELRA